MAKGAINSVKEAVVREALPAARAAITVVKRHGGRAVQDWTKEYWKEQKKSKKALRGPGDKSK